MSQTRSKNSTKSKISACLVVHNDAHQIERCLESIKRVVDEIVIVHDGPCSDDTLKIAKRYTTKVYVGKGYGYPEPHRITTFKKATGDWILILDADEFLSKPLQKNLRKLVDSKKADGYMFLWPFWDGSKYYTHNWPHRIGVVRKKSIHFLAILHPDWTIKGTSIDVPYQLEHRPGYNNVTWGSFWTKWTKWLKIHAGLVVTPTESIPRFQYPETTKPKHIEWIQKWHVWITPYIFVYFFAGAMKLSFPTEGVHLWKYAFFQALYYALLCLEVGKLYIKASLASVLAKP